jgi:hypothetical protein
MKIIKVNESQFSKCFINEYHHAYGNGLEKDAENIANMLCDYYSRGWKAYLDVNNGHTSGFPISYQTSALGNEMYISIFLTTLDCSFYVTNAIIVIDENTVVDAIKSKNIQKLTSYIYHELGHMTNVIKSNNVNQAKKDFETPSFFKMNNQEYQDARYILYRFHTRELKARCFETTMFLKHNNNPNITIQDIYNNRCSDITVMKEFVYHLKNIASQGKNGDDSYIINDLFKETCGKKLDAHTRDIVSWDKKCQTTIWYFEKRYLWLKKRIDKIFSDYKVNY